MANEFSFKPSVLSEEVNKKLVINRLPEWMQSSEQIQVFCDEIIQQWFNPAEQLLVDGYIGDYGSPVAVGKIFVEENSPERQEYQLSPVYASRNDDNSVRTLQFYPELVRQLRHYGSIVDNENRLFSSVYYAWTPPININKIVNFSTYVWDTKNSHGLTTPDYIVMERNAINGNVWSLQNFWYAVGQELPDGVILTDDMSMSSRFIRAKAPIIEFNKDMELVNYGDLFRGEVDYMSDSIKPEDIVQRRIEDEIRVDGNILTIGDRILFTSIGNSGENNRIYKVYVKQLANGINVYGLALDENEENEERPTGEPKHGDVVYIRNGDVYKNKSFYWNSKTWIEAQTKTGQNQFPLFQLYDINGVKLQDPKTYPNSDFKGSNVFGFKINFSYPEDKIYNAHVELSNYNYYVFENFLETKKYTYDRFGTKDTINGLYFYNIITKDDNGFKHEYKSDWVRKENQSKQFVRQVPKMTKNSMLRIFNTLLDLNNFNKPILGMTAYVVETDQNYRYDQRENANFISWNPINSDVYQVDKYETVFELAQKIDPNNKDEVLEVYLDGDLLVENVSRNIIDGVIDSIDLSAYKLTENSIVTIKTFSPTKEYNPELGAYEVPSNLKNNPYNEQIDYIHQGEYTNHFNDIIGKNITKGSVNDINNYENLLEEGKVDNSVGSFIIQNESSMLPLMISTANDDLNIFEAIMYNQAEYFRFKNKFNDVMVSLYQENAEAFMATPPQGIVNDVLRKMNIGKNKDSVFSSTNMGTEVGSTYYIPCTPQYLGILGSYRPQNATPMYIGKTMIRYNIDHCGVASKSYRYINGISLMDDVLFELEQRIYGSIDAKFKDQDYVPVLNSDTLRSTPYYDSEEYTSTEYNKLLMRGYINFVASNNINGNIHKYDSDDWMTWNFTGTTYLKNGKNTNKPARGSWRAIYSDVYGTTRPYSHPWEMFGFTQRPEWFNLEYKPTKVRLSNDVTDFVYVYEAYTTNENGDVVPSGLWDYGTVQGAASKGEIVNGSRRGVYKQYQHFGKQPFTINDTGVYTDDGEMIQTINLLSPMEGMITGSLDHREEPWKVGDMGEIEFTYMNTPRFIYDKALALLRAKPAQFMAYFYDIRNSYLHDTKSGTKQFLFAGTNLRLNINKNTLVHSEKGSRVIGYQVWIADYLNNQNKNVTTRYGNVVRSSGVNVGHRMSGFSKEEHLTFRSDSFGLISQENQHIGLSKSSSLIEQTLSSLKIAYNGSGYTITGYDLVNSTIPYYEPKRTSKRTTIKVGNKSVIHYNDYNKQTIKYFEYGNTLKTIQEVYELICSYGVYLESQGWIFEDTTSDNEINNWNRIARSVVLWTNNTLVKGDYISAMPTPSVAKFGTKFGTIDSVTQYSGGVWTLLDDNFNGIRPDETDTVRLGNVFNIRLNENVDKRMALIRLNVVSYEHAIIFDDKTIFGDNIYIPKLGSVHELIKLYGYVTDKWNGRLQAPGFIILEDGTLPNFEKLVTDFNDYYNNDSPVDNSDINDLSRHLIGFQTRDYLRSLISNESSQVDFYKGFIREKGTQQSLAKVLRVSKTYNTQNYKALEEWAFKLSEYGNVDGKKNLQFRLNNDDFKQSPQLFVYNESADSEFASNGVVSYFGTQGEDSRWINRPRNKFAFPVMDRNTRFGLPNIGPVNLTEIDFTAETFDVITQRRKEYSNTNGIEPSSVWIFSDTNNNWNIFDIVNTNIKLLSIEPIENTNMCKLTFDQNHNLNEDQFYYVTDDINYLPDAMRNERRYHSSSFGDNEIAVYLDVKHTITFDEDHPVLMIYNLRYNTNERIEYVKEKNKFKCIDSSLFERPSTYNSVDNLPETFINVFDPINGVIPDSIMKDISYVSTVDPAIFNSDTGNIEGWGSEHVGKVWWNTTKAFYVDYTKPVTVNGVVDYNKTLEYKRENWGKLLPGSSIDIFEWVKSPVEPAMWEKYCDKQLKSTKKTGEPIPSGDVVDDSSYSVFLEYNKTTNDYTRVYYFWVRNAFEIPNLTSRTKSCSDIARSLQDPMNLNIPWFAPIGDAAFITSGLYNYVTDDKSILSITYQDDKTEVIKHEQFQLCKEGLDYNFNTNVWSTMMNSLVGEETINNISHSLVNKELGCEPGKTWFRDTIEARRTFTDSANTIYKSINLTTNQVLMDEVFNVSTTERNPNLIDIRIIRYNNELMLMPLEDKFKENDAVIVSSNGTLPEPLNQNDIYFVHINDDGYIQLMNSPSTVGSALSLIYLTSRGEGKMTMIKQSDYIDALGTSLDMKSYWDLTDWYDIGYNENSSYFTESSLEQANLKNYQEGELIRVVGSDNIWTLYTRIFTRDIPLWKAVGRQNSTIKLNSRLSDNTQIFNSDGTLTTTEQNIRQALRLLQRSFDGVQSRLVFDMVKYVHTEQTIVPWVFKTSFIYVIGLEQSLQRSYIEQDDLINQIVSYFEEAKPYRTKIRSQIEQKTSDEDEVTGIVNDLDPNGYILLDNVWTKTENDISDFEYAEYDEYTNTWNIKGSLPNDFTTPSRMFQELNAVLQFDNMQCDPSVDLKDVNTTEEINNRYMSMDKDTHFVNDSYKLQRIEYTIPSDEFDSSDNFVSTVLTERYPDSNDNSLQEQIQSILNTMKNDIDKTNAFIDELKQIKDDYLITSDSYNEVLGYVQYNTLVNRVKYSGLSDEDASISVGCPFKGRIISDNPNTRLPFGYGASSSANYGYMNFGSQFTDKFIELAIEKGATEDNIDDYLVHEFGLYRWADDFKIINTEEEDPDYPESHKIFDDLHTVLCLVMGIVEDNKDHYEYVYQMLMNTITQESEVYITIPRKYVVATIQDSDGVVDVPMDISLNDFAEQYYILNNQNIIYKLEENCLDDLVLDKNNPLLSDYKEIITGINDAKLFNDMNSYDNLGLESSTKQVVVYSDGDISVSDSCFIDISELNPNNRDVSMIRVTVSGYNYNTENEIPLKSFGNFQVEAKAILNPYNTSELIMSIPRYDEAMSLMNRELLSHDAVTYSHHISAVKENEIIINNHTFVVGDKLAIFTPCAEDYDVLMFDNTYKTVLKVDSIRTGNRPTLFEITQIDGNKLTIDGFKPEVDLASTSPDLFHTGKSFGISAVRITNFSDEAFNTDVTLYSTHREYKVDVLDYDVFYDRWIEQGTYNEFDILDVDSWYLSNEIYDSVNGEIDNGYYLPTYGKGALSELTRLAPKENLQIFVYEFDNISPEIKPRGKIWRYKDLENSSCKLSVLYTSSDSVRTKVSYIKEVGEFDIENGVIISNNVVNDDIITSTLGSMYTCVNKNRIVDGVYNSTQLEHQDVYTLNGVNLGQSVVIESNYETSKGTEISYETYLKLLSL